jgi:hypothetical protein
MRGLAAQSALYVFDCPVPASIQGSRADYTWLVDLLHCCDHLSSRSGRRLPYNPTTPTHRQRRVTTGGRRRKIAARRGGVASRARQSSRRSTQAPASRHRLCPRLAASETSHPHSAWVQTPCTVLQFSLRGRTVTRHDRKELDVALQPPSQPRPVTRHTPQQSKGEQPSAKDTQETQSLRHLQWRHQSLRDHPHNLEMILVRATM